MNGAMPPKGPINKTSNEIEKIFEITDITLRVHGSYYIETFIFVGLWWVKWRLLDYVVQ